VVGETLRQALNNLALVAPAWLRAVSPPDKKDRYALRAEGGRLPPTPAARAAFTLTIGNDGWRWLAAIDHPNAPTGRLGPRLGQDHLFDALHGGILPFAVA
jgi:hypothetical protein